MPRKKKPSFPNNPQHVLGEIFPDGCIAFVVDAENDCMQTIPVIPNGLTAKLLTSFIRDWAEVWKEAQLDALRKSFDEESED